MDKKFDGIDKRLNSHDQRFDTLQHLMMQGFEIVHERFDRMEKKVETIITNHENRIRLLEKSL